MSAQVVCEILLVVLRLHCLCCCFLTSLFLIVFHVSVIVAPPVHQPGEELGSSPIHSSPIGGDDDEGERTPLLGHVASGSGRHSAINVGSDTATVTPVSSDSIANPGGPPAANGRASRLSREDSRLRSGE